MDRDQVEDEVRARRQTPAWAERQAEENGWEPFAPVQMPWSFFDGAGLWPINFAVMWLSCETPELAAVNWNRLRFWGRHVWRDVPDEFHFAQASLNEALQKGKLVAWGKADVAWIKIPQIYWEDWMFWDTEQDFASASVDGQTILWNDVRISRVDVMALRSKALGDAWASVEWSEVGDGGDVVSTVSTKSIPRIKNESLHAMMNNPRMDDSTTSDVFVSEARKRAKEMGRSVDQHEVRELYLKMYGRKRSGRPRGQKSHSENSVY